MGNLFIVATPIGNLNDLSPRAIDTLTNSDLILAEDTRQTIKLLNHFNIKNKMISYHKFNEAKRTLKIIEDLKNGKNISLVSDAGTPCISDPGYILVKEARRNGINVLAVPGCSAVISALSVGGLDTSSFSFYGFVPIENKLKKELFEEIKTTKVKTKVIYESPKRILKTLEELSHEIPGSVVSVCSELTKVHENCIHGNIDQVIEKMKSNSNDLKGEYVILISNDPITEDKNNNISLEAMIVDKMVKNSCSMKEAINHVNKENKNVSKKEIYNSSLKLKDIIK